MQQDNNSVPNIPSNPSSEGMSYNTKVLITVLLLIFVYPVGLIFMWMWMRWKVWVKLLISFLVIIPLIIIFSGIFLVITNLTK